MVRTTGWGDVCRCSPKIAGGTRRLQHENINASWWWGDKKVNCLSGFLLLEERRTWILQTKVPSPFAVCCVVHGAAPLYISFPVFLFSSRKTGRRFHDLYNCFPSTFSFVKYRMPDVSESLFSFVPVHPEEPVWLKGTLWSHWNLCRIRMRIRSFGHSCSEATSGLRKIEWVLPNYVWSSVFLEWFRRAKIHKLIYIWSFFVEIMWIVSPDDKIKTDRFPTVRFLFSIGISF